MIKEKIWAVIAIILLIVGLGAGYGIGQFTAPVEEKIVEVPVYPLKGEIPIGVISADDSYMKYYAPLTSWAEEEINDYIKKLGYDFSLKFYLECARGSPTTALEKVQSFYAMGIKVVLGMMYSSQIKAVYNYVNERKIVVISDHSTSSALSIPNDYVFRLCPDDTTRGLVLAKMHESLGIKAVVVLQVGDAYGDGVYSVFTKQFEAIGGVIVDHIRYSPEATEFSSEIAFASTKIQEAIETYGKEKVALQLICLGPEVLILLPTAASYPVLLEVPWFNADTASRAVEAGELAVRTKWIAPEDAATASSKYEEFAKKYRDLIAEEPAIWFTNFFDSAWITALSIIQAAKYDGEVLKEVIPKVASQYFGVSGWCNLNENGDKYADYEIRMIREVEGAAKFVRAGTYSFSAGIVTWIVPPEELRS
jgi:branched-chain amino acid transport system substrate-binding protein